MDPVSVFNALYDTRCLRFNTKDSTKSAPYNFELRRLSLYPKLLDAVVKQVVQRYLSEETLLATFSQIQASQGSNRRKISDGQQVDQIKERSKLGSSDDSFSDADSHLDEESVSAGDDFDYEKLCDSLHPTLCGLAHAAIPLAAAIAYKAKLPYLTQKKPGQPEAANQEQVDTSEQTRSIILIQDVSCPSEQLIKAVAALQLKGFRVECVICIVDHDDNEPSLEMAGIKVLSLYNMSAILRILETTGRISSDQYERSRQWMNRGQSPISNICPPIKPELTTISIPVAQS